MSDLVMSDFFALVIPQLFKLIQWPKCLMSDLEMSDFPVLVNLKFFDIAAIWRCIYFFGLMAGLIRCLIWRCLISLRR